MSKLFTPDWKTLAAKTRDDAEAFGEEEKTWLTCDEVIAYLEESPRHAIVLYEMYDDWFETTKLDPPVYVIRGASEQSDDYYYGNCPAEDPTDGTPETSAEQAICGSIANYY